MKNSCNFSLLVFTNLTFGKSKYTERSWLNSHKKLLIDNYKNRYIKDHQPILNKYKTCVLIKIVLQMWRYFLYFLAMIENWTCKQISSLPLYLAKYVGGGGSCMNVYTLIPAVHSRGMSRMTNWELTKQCKDFRYPLTRAKNR